MAFAPALLLNPAALAAGSFPQRLSALKQRDYLQQTNRFIMISQPKCIGNSRRWETRNSLAKRHQTAATACSFGGGEVISNLVVSLILSLIYEKRSTR